MTYQLGDKEAAAEQKCRPSDLATYLRHALIAGRSQCDLAREFQVSRLTIRNWLAKRNLQPVRTVHTRTRLTSRRPKGH